jgi:hypothetical protein
MVFAEATDERSLSAFENDSEAIAYCEGIDVTEGSWLFWDDSGNPLEPVFFTAIGGGKYTLQRSTSMRYVHLMEALDSIRTFDAGAPFDCKEGVRAHISQSAPI